VLGAAGVNVLTVSVTERGAALARALPFAHVHGLLADTVRSCWADVDGFVLCCAVGVAVRVVGPLLASKASDPAVVCVDEDGRFVVAVVGGHGAGANDLARDVAALLGATPVVTTATDAVGVPALDTLAGFTAAGDLAGVTRAWLDGTAPEIVNPLDWPLPPALTAEAVTISRARWARSSPVRIVVTDAELDAPAGTAVLHPPSLIAGVGASSGTPAAEVETLLGDVLRDRGLARASVATVATIDLKAVEPGIMSLGLPLHTFPAAALAAVTVPNPSAVVDDAVGTPSVAEAAALLAAGPDAELLAPKRASAHATVAISRRRHPVGHLAVVGLGPGAAEHRTPAATAAVRSAAVVVGYGPYVDQCVELLSPAQTVVRSPIGQEADRCREALGQAAAGRRVALVSSGDAGVFAMASLALELAPSFGAVEVTVIPGVTAALAAAALVGAPLGHDHASISLSDLVTPWPVIERRLRAVAEADMAVALYNPRSARRTHQLEDAKAILLDHRPATTPTAVVTDAARPGQRIVRTTLGQLDAAAVHMLSIVLIGASATRWLDGRMVTPRGYEA
jgi:cobalt-precorrin 5A hydrolase/precorrin-3B C17-methyltransferase